MVELLKTAKDLGFPPAFILILVFLYGSYAGWWLWKREVTKIIQDGKKLEADYEERLEAERIDKNEWKDLALSGHRLARVGLTVVQKQAEDPI